MRGAHEESSTSDSSGSLFSRTKPRGLLPDKGNRPARPPQGEFWGRIPAPRRSPALDLKSECCAQLSFRLQCYQDWGSSGEIQHGDWGEEAGRKVPALFFLPRCFPEVMNFGALSWGGPRFTAIGHLVSSACLSRFRCARLFVTQAPPSTGFSRQEYQSGLPCPLPGDLPDPGIEPVSLMSPAWAGGFLLVGATWLVPHLLKPAPVNMPLFLPPTPSHSPLPINRLQARSLVLPNAL